MSRIDRIKRSVSARRAARTAADRLDDQAALDAVNLPVPVGPVLELKRSFRDDRTGGDSEFQAQLLGQDGQRRGLRAGPTIHDVARHAYGSVEWSGSYDRRLRAGTLAKKLI